MRRTKLVLAAAAVMAALLVAFAAPAMAKDNNHDNDFRFHHLNNFDNNRFDNNFLDDNNDFLIDDFGFHHELFFIDDEESFDDVCSPGLPNGIFIPGCIFSDDLNDNDFRFDNGF